MKWSGGIVFKVEKMKRLNWFSKLIFLSLLAFSGLAAESYAVPHGDFDGDGLPDLVAIQKGKKNTLWIVRLSSTNTNRHYNFNKVAGDAMIAQRRNGLTFPGLVRVDNKKKPLRWIINQPDGSYYTFRWGKPGDKITETGDFDGNGIDDCVAVRNGTWNIALDCNPANVRSFVWGNPGETVHVFNDPVLNVAAAYVLRNVNGNLHWVSRTLSGVSRDMTFGLASDIPVGVEAFNGTGTTRHLALARRTATGMVLYLGSAAGTITRNLGTNSGIPFVGANNARGFYGIYDRSNAFTAIATLATPTTFVQHGGSGYWFVDPSGTVYPVGVEANGIVGSSGGSGGGGGGPSINFAGCTKTLDTSDGHGKGFTWNPTASKGPKLILPTSYIQGYTVENIKLYHPDGTFNRNMDFYGYEDSRQRWYANGKPSPSALPKNMVIVIKLMNSDLGSGYHCAQIANPVNRYD